MNETDAFEQYLLAKIASAQYVLVRTALEEVLSEYRLKRSN